MPTTRRTTPITRCHKTTQTTGTIVEAQSTQTNQPTQSTPPTQPTRPIMSNEESIHRYERKFEKFTGADKEIRIQTWLRLFEVHTEGQNEEKRIISLMYSLGGSALEWYGDEIAGRSITQWEVVKNKFIKRFGVSTATPLIDAQRLYLKRDQTVEEYFREKMRLLRQTNLSEDEIIQQLTEGLPFSWKMTITASRPADTSSWVEIAQQIEAHQKSANRKPLNINPRHQRSKSFNLTAPVKPRTPCQYCLKRGKEEFHWHRECPNNTNWNQPDQRGQRDHRTSFKTRQHNTTNTCESSPSSTEEVHALN